MKTAWLPEMPINVATLLLDPRLATQSDAKIGRIIRVLSRAWIVGEPVDVPQSVRPIIDSIWPEYDELRRKLHEKHRALSEAGSRGGRPPKEREALKPSESQALSDAESTHPHPHPKKKDTHSARDARRVSDEVFGNFWAQYPRKESRKDALRAWGKVDVEEWPLVTAGLLRWKASEQWQRGIIPHAATWLNREQWREEPMVRPSAPPSPPDPSRRNSFVPEPARQNIPTADETRARIRAEDEERRRQELRAQLRSVS